MLLSLLVAAVVVPQQPASLAAAPAPEHRSAGPATAEPHPAEHWAYTPPVRRTPPVAAASPIDGFLLARQRAAGLTPNGEADRRTLVRRVFLDLTGLPPTPAEVEAFVADGRPDAYDRLVDRLLASPHYGERWASPWLDLARYGDSDGFNFDKPRSMWPWRDWVVDALNRDVPFDRFTEEQLAGDLLPDADESTRIATGFHRNTPLNDEGGVDADEARWQRLLDRASTTATVWLGSTLQCAQCHDHKYDPISQRDFYGMVAFFETQDEVDLTRAADGAKTLVLRERDDADAATYLRLRGAYDSKGELVAAHVPAALHAWPDGVPRNRLTLARWLCSRDNPLTARVAVNRLWDQLFGRGLVDTPEDFGRQAPVPQHLDLLDWLATEFVRLGWSQKQLLRTIVRSAAYRRDAASTPQQRELDPQNRLYAHGTRFRLDAERIRDTWLAVGGLLSPKMGGPPVYPLQADTSGVVPINKVSMKWPTSPGEDRWRRGIYTYWRRTAPFVAFALFDAPSREQCQVRRQSTNTPLQALAGLNDPTAQAAAAALGERMAGHAGDARDRLAFGFELCTARPPTATELDHLAAAFAAEPGPSAFVRIATVLLNLDETLCRP
ncbi:MAG TPA: DUF1549 and DUF1553 domain-containing protein [Planctomycetota bacterium]|nr:DUF1549 and DUF1553 domain-containing protein [Planctomycetota bacterium]